MSPAMRKMNANLTLPIEFDSVVMNLHTICYPPTIAFAAFTVLTLIRKILLFLAIDELATLHCKEQDISIFKQKASCA